MTRLDISDVVLEGAGVPPDRAEGFRGVIAAQIEHLLRREGLTRGRAEAGSEGIIAPPLHPNEMQNDMLLAQGIAERVVRAVRNLV